jgi:2-methylcitrate dehydratase
MTQVEALAKDAARASFADLSAESRKQLPSHILDLVACCIAALGAAPIEACHEQVAEFGGISPCTLIGGGQANPIYAAFWHTALVRYVDFMDNFWLEPKPATPRIISAWRLPSPNTWEAVDAI